MLGREPRSEKELLMVYSGILAHGTSMSAAETARMMPQLSAASVRQAAELLEFLRNLTETLERQYFGHSIGSFKRSVHRVVIPIIPSNGPNPIRRSKTHRPR